MYKKASLKGRSDAWIWFQEGYILEAALELAEQQNPYQAPHKRREYLDAVKAAYALYTEPPKHTFRIDVRERDTDILLDTVLCSRVSSDECRETVLSMMENYKKQNQTDLYLSLFLCDNGITPDQQHLADIDIWSSIEPTPEEKEKPEDITKQEAFFRCVVYGTVDGHAMSHTIESTDRTSIVNGLAHIVNELLVKEMSFTATVHYLVEKKDQDAASPATYEHAKVILLDWTKAPEVYDALTQKILSLEELKTLEQAGYRFESYYGHIPWKYEDIETCVKMCD